MKKTEGACEATSLASVAAESYCNQLHRYLLANAARDDVPDIAQEVYCRLLKIPFDDLIRNVEAYVITCARQVMIEYQRRERRQRSRVCADSELLAQLADNPEELCSDEPARWVTSSDFFEKFLAEIPPEWAAALLLHERDGLSHREVAQSLEVTERMVRRYLMKARQELHRRLAAEHASEAKDAP